MSLPSTSSLEAQDLAHLPDCAARWRMPLVLRASIAVHVALLLTVTIWPSAWPWALALFGANHLLIALLGLWPRSQWLGPNLTRLPAAAIARREIALTIDDGPHPEITPQVLDLLDRHKVKATFFCVGEKAARYPDLCRSIVERGHSVENHSASHRHSFSLLGLAAMRREVQNGQEILTRITGRRPLFFRPPAGLRNPLLDPLLTKAGLRLASWSRRGYDTRTANPAVVLRRLLRALEPGAILLVHDDNCARTPAGVPVVLAVLPDLIKAVHNSGLHFTTLPAALRS